jgi:hypothetical protein
VGRKLKVKPPGCDPGNIGASPFDPTRKEQKMKRHVIQNFEDIKNEARMLPDLNKSLHFQMDSLESVLFAVGEKHGVFDELFNDNIDKDDQDWNDFWD